MAWLVPAIMFGAAFFLPDSSLGTLPRQSRWILASIGGIWVATLVVTRWVVPAVAMQKEKDRQSWSDAQGEVLEVAETGTYVNQQPRLKVRLRVTVGDGPAHEATAVQLFSILDVPNLKVGSVVPVKVDPSDSSRVFVEADSDTQEATRHMDHADRPEYGT